MTSPPTKAGSSDETASGGMPAASLIVPRRIALVGNPNTGKTTLFNTLTGLRHRTSNFPGTTQEARLGRLDTAPGHPTLLIDLPGIYSLALEVSESRVCREALLGRIAPTGERAAVPDALIVVVDATNLSRNLTLVGEVLARRLPTLVVLTMVDRATAVGEVASIEGVRAAIAASLGCPVIASDPRERASVAAVLAGLSQARISDAAIPVGQDALEAWATDVSARARGAHGTPDATGPRLPREHGPGFDEAGRVVQTRQSATAHSDGAAPAESRSNVSDALNASSTPPGASPSRAADALRRDRIVFHASHSRGTDRLDHILMHPLAGPLIFAAVMALLFWAVFSLATIPMGWIDASFSWLAGAVRAIMPAGDLADLLCDGIIGGVGATVVFLPQICLLFLMIALLEDTGYLARAAFVADRLLRPFGLRGHAFVPLLSSHACALPGIMACRAIPDPKERLAAILVAPFMTCSARLPVYVLLASILFPGRPALSALAFIGCYAMGIAAALFSALLARRTLLKGQSRPMVMELPAYKWPSVKTALVTTWDRAIVFTRKAGTVILAICIVLWWLQAYPHAGADPEATRIREAIAVIEVSDPAVVAERQAEADALDARRQQFNSFAGRLGRLAEPVFAPLGYDWRLCIGVVSSFAAREVFVSTMSVVVSGTDDPQAEGVMDAIASARRDDGTPLFTVPTAVSLLVFYVLAMQCLPTLAVTAREAGSAKWALLQLGWMSGMAYVAALIAYQSLVAAGVG